MIKLINSSKSLLSGLSTNVKRANFLLVQLSKFSVSVKDAGNDSPYSTIERGQKDSSSYRMYFKDQATNQFISPFHDIPIFNDVSEKILNVVIEIPRWTNAKLEINKENKLNPIIQDTKKGQLRYVNNVFPHHGYIWNYGGIPQTWEDPNVIDKTTQCIGDNDPLDVMDIGSKIHESGSVIGVKVLGALGLIDEGEADWKIVSIDVNDPMAKNLNDISDVDKYMPGFLNATRDWYKYYKVPTGKPTNNFAENGKFFDRDFAFEIINHDHDSWKKLLKGDYPEAVIQLENTLLDLSSTITQKEANKIVKSSEKFDKKPADIDMLPIDTVHFVERED